jgi:hypothetical protein
MQQRVELLAVAGGKRGVKRAGEIGRAAAFHPKTPFFESAVITGRHLEAADGGARRRRSGKSP